VPESAANCPKCGADIATGFVAVNGNVTEDSAGSIAPSAAPSLIANSVQSRISHVSVVEDDGRFLPGAVVAGRYRILGMLGKGGMGEVYKATDLALAQSVALKFLHADVAGNQRWLERFHAEVRIARQISHPNVCRVYDIGEADGVPFLSMEYLDGDDIATLLVGIGRLPYDKALDTARKVCAGLAAAHDKGVIHRDLKPQNIMMTKRGEILITDFGLAAVADTLRGAEARNGTPAYMSPEQLRGSEVSAKSDIYALGLVLYELFTGKKPFEARTIPELISLQESQQLSSMKSYAAEIDPAVEGIIRKCLHPDPAMRPASALAVAAALPGGDPLAAALAAGETPSPELLAASGKREAVPMRYTLPVLLFVLIALLGTPFLYHRYFSMSYTPLDMPPDVLQQKARDNAALLGYTDSQADQVYEYRFHTGYLIWINDNWKKDKDWHKLFHSEPPQTLFYRQSPRLMSAWPDGRVTETRPPQNVPGMWSMDVDTRGLLRRFSAVPPSFEEQPPVSLVPADPKPVFQAAGLAIANFTPVPPQWTPAMAFDQRLAWKGKHPAIPELDLTVQIAFWRGRVVDVRLIWPWTKPAASREETPDSRRILNSIVGGVLSVAGLIFCLWLANRNLKSGRGDRTGATRLAITYFVLRLIAVPTFAHFVPDGITIEILFANSGIAAFQALLLWMLYIGLEPAVRARWPHSIVTWSRALKGQFSDPQLGAHILYGTGLGVGMTAVISTAAVVSFHAGEKPFNMGLDTVLSTSDWIGSLAALMSAGLVTGMIIVFLLFGARQIVRRDWLAAILVGLVLASRNAANWDIKASFALPMLLVIYSGLMFTLMRVGMVAIAVAIFVTNTLTNTPATLDPQVWYGVPSYLRLVVLALVAWYGFTQSRGDRNPETEAALP